MMRKSVGGGIAAAATAFAVVGLVACGVTPRSGANGEAAPADTPGAETTVVATWGTITRLPTPSGSPSPTPVPSGGTITPGQVTVTLDKPAYHTTDPITAYVNNGLPASIFAADHQSGCTIVTLEQLVGGAWQPLAKCRLMTPTRLVEIAAGMSAAAQFGRPGQVVSPPWPAGTYRIAVAYSGGADGGSPVYSSVFEIRP